MLKREGFLAQEAVSPSALVFCLSSFEEAATAGGKGEM
jgi:hypothetical protein